MWPRGPGSPRTPAGRPTPASTHTRCAFVLTVALSAPKRARSYIRAWLSGLLWPDGALDDIEYAVNEAVSNAVEHAYRPLPTHLRDASPASGPSPGPACRPADRRDATVAVTARVEAVENGRRVRVTVRDHGRWRPPPTDPGHRGRGVQLMRTLMHEVVIIPDTTGTEVVLVSPTVPVPRRTQP